MNKELEIKKLKEKIKADQSLPFRKTALNLVFGEGSLNPKVYFLGEAPGRFEDETGRPFVGRSGKFLREQISKSGIDQKDVYITSVVRFRPPNNRTPKPFEVAAYEKYVNEELRIIQPKIIVTLGAVSLKKFSTISITKIHAKLLDIEWFGLKFKLFPLFHPAAALRNPKIKRLVESDFKKLKKILTTV
jgi:uracil-DNA glycosylase family 4